MAYTFYKIAAFSGGWHQGQIGVELVSQDIPGNYSVVNLIFQVKETTNASSYNLGGANMYIALDGTVKASSTTIDFRSYATGTWYTNLTASNVVVYHNADGTRSFSFQGYCATGVGAGTYNPGAQTVTLPTIPRKSSISSLTSSVSVNGTNEVTVGISRADSSFTHTVLFSIGSYSQSYTNVATSQAYAIPLAWMNAIPNAVSGTATCRVTTFNGGVDMGYVESTFAITVPSTVIPVVSDIAFAKDTTGTDPFPAGTYVVGISKVSATGITVTNQYSATTSLLQTYIHDNDLPYTSAISESMVFSGASFISNTIRYSGVNNITVYETDSRGRVSAAYVETITAYSYAAPSLTVTGERCDSLGTIDPNGEYLKFRFQAVIDPVNSTNTKTYTMEYKRTIDSTWTNISTASLTGYTADYSVVRAASSSYTWQVRGTVQDRVNTISKTADVETASVVIDFLSGGGGMAIGKVAETPNLMECELPAQFNDAVSITGVLTAPIITEGRSRRFITATAGSNGDFYVTLLGTLATNDIVWISFPAATNGASNARLSVDNGTTYKEIRMTFPNGTVGYNVLASAVQGSVKSFRYDGTYFQPINELSMYIPITLTLVAPAVTLVAGSAKYYPHNRTVDIHVIVDMGAFTINTSYPIFSFSAVYSPPFAIPLASINAAVTPHTSAYTEGTNIYFSSSTSTGRWYISGSYLIA